jgi:hypothetical protein
MRSYRRSQSSIDKPVSLTLDDILNSDELSNKFKQFLMGEHCCENLDFLRIVERYKQSIDSVEKLYLKSVILQEFIQLGSKNELNISQDARSYIFNICNNTLVTPIHLFEKAELEVRLLLERDSIPRFLRVSEGGLNSSVSKSF